VGGLASHKSPSRGLYAPYERNVSAIPAIDTTTPAGKAMFQMMGVFAEFERAMIQDRVKAGLERARAQGKTLGRPKVGTKVRQNILAARSNGNSIRSIATEVGVSVGTVHGVIKEAA
jgi:DNA invertase Pin-like site-specific DNA recombinase